MRDYQLAVVGAGPGGYVAAIKAAQLGLKTVLIEKDKVGGTCLNRGCIPTKALLHTAGLYHQAQTAEEIGLAFTGASYNLARMHEKKDEVVASLRKGVAQLVQANKITLLSGVAVITGANEITVTGEETQNITTDAILVATGSVPLIPPIEGADLPGVLTSNDLLEGEPVDYDSITIIGGGVIGVEFATYYNFLGKKVTLIEAMDRLLPGADREISQNLAMILKRRGVAIETKSMVKNIIKEPDGLSCHYQKGEEELSATSSAVLLAIGRRAFCDGLFAEGITPKTEKGRLITDENFATSVPGIYAIGDVSSKIQLAHFASAQGIAAVEHIAGHPSSVNLLVVPSCIYAEPEIAYVGLDAEQAEEAGIPVKTGKFSLAGNAKTMIEGGDRSFIKIVAHEQTGAILGAQLMCGRATDLVAEFATAIANGLTAGQMSAVIRPHPTFCEAATEAYEDILGGAVHAVPKKVR